MIRHWKQLSDDPNDERVKQWRAQRLSEARSNAIIQDRIEHLCSLARGKNVLDIGCVGHFTEASERQDWLHGRLARAAATCLGVDVVEEAIRNLAAKGYRVRLADVVLEPLTERFDVVICGEIIEHVNAPGALFSSIARMLMPGGILALTTPYPWYFGWIVKNLVNGSAPVGSADHVAWYDPCTLAELGERHGLRLRSFAGIADQETSRRLAMFKSCLRLLAHVGMRPEVSSRSLLYEFELADPS